MLTFFCFRDLVLACFLLHLLSPSSCRSRSVCFSRPFHPHQSSNRPLPRDPGGTQSQCSPLLRSTSLTITISFLAQLTIKLKYYVNQAGVIICHAEKLLTLHLSNSPTWFESFQITEFPLSLKSHSDVYSGYIPGSISSFLLGFFSLWLPLFTRVCCC